MPVKALSWPPLAAMIFENFPGGIFAVPLNIMCSSTWEIPVMPLCSLLPPTLYQICETTTGAR